MERRREEERTSLRNAVFNCRIRGRTQSSASESSEIVEQDNLEINSVRDVGATTYPCKNLSFCSLSSSAFVRTQKPILPQLLGLLVNPQETFQVLLMMLQLVAGQTDVTPHRTSRVHTEGTVGGSDLENKALVFSLRLLKQSKGRGIQGSCDREKGLFP